MKGLMWLIIGVVGCLIFTTIRIVYAIQFNISCDQYLKRAGDANSIELAKANIEPAPREDW